MAYKYGKYGNVEEVPDGTPGSYPTWHDALVQGYVPATDPRDTAQYTDSQGIARTLNGALVDHDREIHTDGNNQRTDIAPGDDFNAGGGDFNEVSTSLTAMDQAGISPSVRVENQNRIFQAGKDRYDQLIAQGMPPFQAREQARVFMSQEVEKVKTQYIPGYTPDDTYTPRATPNGATSAADAQRPATNAPVSTVTTSGVLSNPGEGEKWFSDHKSAYDAPTNLAKMWNGGSGTIDADNTDRAFGQAKQAYNKGQAGVDNAQGLATDLRDRTAGESTLGQAKGYFTQPNQALAYQKQTAGIFGQEGAAETYAKSQAGNLSGSGQGGQQVYKTMGDFGTPGAAERNNDTAQSMLQGNNSTKQFNSGLQNSGFAKQNTTGAEMDYFRPELRQKSRSESLYDSGQGENGLNTYYDRQSTKQSKALTDQMAAMGVFGSGATARSLSELHSDLGASQARDMAGLAAQADNSFLGRTGQAQSFASASGDEAVKRNALGLQSATAADESTRGNVAGMNQASQNAQNAQIDRMFKGGQLGLQADQEARQRAELGGTLANTAQTQQLNRLQQGGNLAKSADESVINQGRGLADVGNLQATQELNRLKQSADTGLAADQESRNNLKDYFDMAKGRDQSVLDFANHNTGMARDLDAQDYARLQAGQAAATGAQNSFEQRERYGIQDKSTLAQNLSSIVQGAKGKSADEQAQIYENVIQSYIAETGVDRAAAENYATQMFQAAGIVLKAKGK